MNKTIKILLFTFFTFFIAFTVVKAINTLETGYMLPPNTTFNIDVHGEPRSITNNSASNTYFIPTLTVEEWSFFYTNTPLNTSIQSGSDIEDCNGELFGFAVEDECGVCDEDTSNDCVQDCNGDWDGEAPDDDEDGICNWNDADSYETVQIGTQLWMAENLKVTHYKNGDEIPTGYSNEGWSNISTGAYAIYDNNLSNLDIYGLLYNWYAVNDNRGLCPEGWHVPTQAEWAILGTTLGGDNNGAGKKMKEVGFIHWNDPGVCYPTSEPCGGTNDSGFTALGGGAKRSNGFFYSIGDWEFFWASDEPGGGVTAYRRWLRHNNSRLYGHNNTNHHGAGYSIRCING